MVTVQVILHHFHRLELFETGFLGNLVFTIVSIMFQVADICYVAYIAYLVSYMSQITEQQVESDSRPCVAQVGVTVNRRTANVHTHMRFVQWDELFLFSCECVINAYWMFHIYLYLRGANLQ